LSTSATSDETVDLQAYIAVLRSRKSQIGLVTLVVLAATLAFSLQQTKIYEGEAKVLVRPVLTSPNQVAPPVEPNLDTESQLVQSQAVANLVRNRLDLERPDDDLLQNVKVNVVADTEVLVVRFDDPDPSTAAKLANAFAAAYTQFRSKQSSQQIVAAIASLNRKIVDTQSQVADVERKLKAAGDPATQARLSGQRDSFIAELGVLRQRLIDLQSAASLNQDAAAVVERAEVPTTPASPQIIRNAILAFIAGLILGVGIAFLRERLDDRLRGRGDLEEQSSAPVLAVIPKVDTWRERDEPKLITLAEAKSAASEAYRTLRTSVMFAASQKGLKALMVTSPGPGEGKTTTAANLAVVLAQADKRVILVSADLRKPRIHRFFGLSNKRGLVNVLAGETQVGQVLQAPEVAGLRLLGAGPSSGRPAEWLQSERMGELLGTLRDQADFVIIDAAPILVVADPLALAPMVDGVLFVADAEDTSRHAVERAREHLDQVGAKIIGCVLNDFDPGKARSYEPYGYRRSYYGRRYRYAEDGYGAGYETGNGQIEQPTPAPVPPAPRPDLP
jgi:polysaccharide biosynthesis transport protein